MQQGWYDLAYVHFRYPVHEVARLLPAGLEVDTFDGDAWVGLIPFSMRAVGLPRLPAVPYLGNFSEVNVRTYVRRNGVPGVWFFSLDVDRLLPAVVARLTYRLPYCWGRTTHRREGDQLVTDVDRRWPRPAGAATTMLRVRMGDPIAEPDDLAVFLSARWGLFSAGRSGRLRYAPVDHPRWPLHTAEIVSIDDHLVTAAGLPSPETEPHVMWSPGVPVRIGLPHRA
jgi:uncharacterized protein YqjF (DUF2071 family)